MNIPLIDMQRQYNYLSSEIDKAIKEVCSSGKYILGNKVNKFEEEAANYLGCKYSISCANGTDALILSLTALGVKQGDEIITTPYTFFATAEAISKVGAVPVFIDVDKKSYNINPSMIEKKISDRTRGIIPVHLFGNPANIKDIIDIANRYNLFVIEDACQSIGAEYKGKMVGTFGDTGCFSFFPTKNLGAFGDGGMVVTNNDRIAKLIKGLRTHGSGKPGKEAYDVLYNESTEIIDKLSEFNDICNEKYYNYLIGFNSRLDEIQAAILSVKLKSLDKWIAARQRLSEYYSKELKNSNLVTPYISNDSKSAYNLYVVQSEKRDKLVKYLKEFGISTGIYYPVPLHLQKVYSRLGYKEGDFPVSEYLSKRTLALPLFPELTKDEQEYIIKCIYEFERG